MKVKCIDANGTTGITEGKEYSVKRVNPDNKTGLIEIMDDSGHPAVYTSSRFESLENGSKTSKPVKKSEPAAPQLVNPPEPVEVLDMQALSNRLEKATCYINKEVGGVVKCFCKIGFKLLEVRENKLYLGQDFKNVSEYAEKVLGFKKSSTANYISICERFSERKDGKPTAKLSPKFADFSYTQLSLMLPLPDEKIANITPETTCQEIRDLKNSAQSSENDGEGSEDENGENSGNPPRKRNMSVLFETDSLNVKAVETIGKLLSDYSGLKIRILAESKSA